MTMATAGAATGGAAMGGPGSTRPLALTVLVCFALNMVDGMDVLVLSYIAPALQREWRVGPAELSIAFSAGLAGMAAGGTLLAPLADRFGRRRLLVAAIVMMAAAMLASSRVGSVAELAAVRFMVGTGIGTVLACMAAIVAQAAPEARRSLAVGVLQGGYPIGAMITGFVVAWALPLFGWRHVLVGTAAVSALFAPLILVLLPAHVPQASDAGEGRAGYRTLLADGRLRASVLLWTAMICGFMALYFITSWITKLSIEAGLPEEKAIIASAIYSLGAFIGTTGMSVLSARIDIRYLSLGLLSAAAVAFLVFGGVRMPLGGVLAGALLMGIALQGGVNTLYPIAARVYPEAVRATGIGLATGVGRIGAFLGPMIGGAALDAHLPLVAVFGIFCLPLLTAAVAARSIGFPEER